MILRKEIAMQTVQIKAEPLTPEAFRPFGQVVGRDDVKLDLREGEEFRMGIIHMPNRGYCITSLNHHRNSTQALIPLEGKACLVIVAPPGATFKEAADLKQVRAFLCDGSMGINIGLHTWHQALLPIGAEMKMVNIQGVHSSQDTYECDFQQEFEAAIEVIL
jgi:ureidoglycolate lyase